MYPEDSRYNAALNEPVEGLSLDVPGQVIVSNAVQPLQPQPLPVTEQRILQQVPKRASLFKFNSLAAMITVVAMVLVLLAGGLTGLFSGVGIKYGNKSSQSSNYPVGSTLAVANAQPQQQLALASTDTLAINGQLKVNQTLVLTPSAAPSKPVTGQIYYNKSTNKPYYYNGTGFISLEPTSMPTHVTSVGGNSGNIAVGDGLQMTSSGTLSLTADIINQIQFLSASAVLSINSASGNLAVTNDGSGNYTLTNNSIGTSSVGQIALYTGAQTLGGSVLSQSGGAVTDSGNLTVQGSGGVTVGVAGSTAGSVSLANATNSNLSKLQAGAPSGVGTANYNLPTIAGGTSDTFCLTVLNNCAASGTAGGDLIGSYPNPTIAKLQGSTLTISGQSGGQVLLYNGSQFVNQTVSGDVTINSSGVTTIGNGKVTNADLVNSSLTINNGTNVTGGGVVSLGGSLTLGVANSPIFSGNLTVLGSGGVIVGVAGVTNGVVRLANSTNSNLSVIQAGVPSGSGTASYFLPTIAGGTSDTLCLVVLSNCGAGGAGGGNVNTAGGIAGSIPLYTGPTDISSSMLTQSGSTLTASGSLVLQGANSLKLGTATTNNGDIAFYNSTNSNTVKVQSGITSSSYSLTLPTSAGSVNDCLVNSGSGALIFTACTGGLGGGVTSLDSQTGVLSLANSSGSAGIVTIDNAHADGSTKGIATFNSTNFSDNGSGVINTVQNINSSASPTFAGLSLSSALTVANGGTGVGTFTSNGVIYGNTTGNLQATAAGTGGQLLLANVSGIPTFTSLTGDITINSSGVTTIGNGKVTNADLVNSSLTVTPGAGLTGGGSVSLGGSTSLAVAYGSSANTAVQGDTALICASGTGNLSGGGNTLTLGTGGTCNSLTVVNAPTFSGLVTGNSGLTVSGTTTLSSLGTGLVLSSSGGVLSSGAVDRNSASYFNTALTVANGGTGVASTTAYGLLAGGTTSTGALQNLGTGTTSQILIGGTLGSAAPTFTLTLPTTVQGNITQTGALTSGSIASGFGTISTANNITSTVQIQGGTFRNTAGTFATDSSGNITSGTVNGATISGGTLSGGTFSGGSVSGSILTGAALTFTAASANSINGTSGQNLTLQSQGAGQLILNSATSGLALQAGAVTQMILTGGVQTYQQTETITAVAATSGTNITLKAGAANSGTNVGGILYLQGGAGNSTGASGSVIVQANTNDSTTAFVVQNASAAAVLTVDTVNTRVGLNVTPSYTLDVNGVINVRTGSTYNFNGVAGASPSCSAGQISTGLSGSGGILTNGGSCTNLTTTKKIILTPEYSGAILDNNGLGSSAGTMTSGYDSTQKENYYKWTTSQSSNQSYYIYVSIPLPTSSTAVTGITVDTKTTSTGNGTIIAALYDTAGTAATNWNTCSLTPSSNNTWQTNGTGGANGTPCAISGGTWAADGVITLRLYVSSPQNGSTQVGNIKVSYTTPY